MSLHKYIVLFALAFVVFSPTIVSAQVSPLCWQEEKCLTQRRNNYLNGKLSPKELKEGFVQNAQTKAMCGEKDGLNRPLGFCLPISQSEAKISYGGQKKFAHLGEFIQVLYGYAITAAGILSVLMLIVAGFTWTTSGGNAERIGSAKKRIAGSLMGLLLAVLSYSLLNTLNPALVNLRMPTIWSVNELGLSPSWCSDVEGDKKVKLLGPYTMDAKKRAKEKEKLTPSTKYDVEPKKAKCGQDYFVQDTGGLSCSGRSCEGDPNGNMCINFDVVSKEKVQKYHCIKSNLVLNMRLSGLFTNLMASLDIVKAFLETVENEWIDIDGDEPELWPVCAAKGSGSLYRGKKKDIPWGQIQDKAAKGGATFINTEVYDYHLIFPNISLKDGTWCKSGDALRGLFVMIELKEAGDNTDPDLWIGMASPKTKNHSTAVAGTWLLPGEKGEAMAYGDYIPVEHLKEGVVLDVDVTDNVFQTIEDYTGSSRSNQMPEKDNTPSKPKCWASPAKKKLVNCPPGKFPSIDAAAGGGSSTGGSTAPAPAPTPGLPGIKGCFVAGTPVSTDTGKIAIEQLDPTSNAIKTTNIDTGITSFQPFKSILTYHVDGYYIVNDGLLEVTGSHPIYVKKHDGIIGWGRIDPTEVHPNGPEHTESWAVLDIDVGDYVLNAAGEWIQIESLDRINKPTTVYNLEYVSDGNTFYANDILVHNSKKV